MEATEPTLVVLTDGKAISTELLSSALQADIGTALGSICIASELAQAVAEFTENPAWKNLPSEPTWAKRIGDDEWEITVGDHREVLRRADIEARLIDALGDTLT